MPEHIIITGIPMAIAAVMRSQQSLSMSIGMPSVHPFRLACCSRESLGSLGRDVALTDLIAQSYRGLDQACNPNPGVLSISSPLERIFVQPNKTNVHVIGGTIRYRGCGREKFSGPSLPASQPVRGGDLCRQTSGRSGRGSVSPG